MTVLRTTDTIVAKLTASPANDMHACVSFADVKSDDISESIQLTTVANSRVTICDAPTGDYKRVVKSIRLCNRETSAVGLTLEIYNGSSYYSVLEKVSVAANGVVVLDGGGLRVLDENGALLTTSSGTAIHGSTHESGGSDSIKLDNFATPDDTTDLNATATEHGLLRKLGSGSSLFLREDGTWAIAGGDATRDLTNEINNAVNARRRIANANSTVEDCVDGMNDDFSDEDGVNTSGSSGELYDVVNDLYVNAVYSSDVCTGGTASASSFYAGYPPSRVFDDSDLTCWYSATAIMPDWVKYDLGSGNDVVARKYTVIGWTSSEAGGMANRAPLDWTFEGSNNDSDWDILDTITGETSWSDKEQRDFVISNAVSYRYYRINISAFNGGSLVSLVELEIMEYVSNAMTLLSVSFEAQTEPTEAVLIVFADLDGSAVLNTDLIGKISNDNGGNFDTLTLVDRGDIGGGLHVYAANVTLTDRTDKTMVWRVELSSTYVGEIYAVSVRWRA